ncbi:hypothetical protein HZB94_00265 [Candidatus Falkowbacteria bacterium]|nr:hypothetical protein [Candidatus Falkowbacteria bacterium]
MFNFQNLNWKKLAIAIGFVLVIIGAGYAIYFLFFKPTMPTAPAPEKPELGQLPAPKEGAPEAGVAPKPGVVIKPEAKPEKPITKIPAAVEKKVDEIAKGGVTKIATLNFEPTGVLTLDKDGGSAITYNSKDGRFYAIDRDGDKKQLNEHVYKNVKNISWSPKKEQAIMEFPDGSNVLYNFDSDKQITLPKDWTEFSFSKSGNQIAFKDMTANPEYRFLAVANADGSGQKYIEYIGDDVNNFKIDWSPNGQMVAQYKTGKSVNTSKLFFLGQNGENFKAITVNGYGVETKWAPAGDKLVYNSYSVSSENKPQLYVVDAAGDNIGYNHNSLKLSTWINKCAFSGANTLYCAVPKQMPEGAGLVPSLADNTPDYIYKVDLETGVKSFVAEPEFDYTIDKMQVSEDGATLYFTDKTTQELHMMKLQ